MGPAGRGPGAVVRGPTDETEFLAHAFLRISDRWTSRRGRAAAFDISPSEGDEFYNALVEAVIVAPRARRGRLGCRVRRGAPVGITRFDRLDPPPDEPE